MGALLDRFAAEGLQIESTDDGKLRVTGRLTDRLSDAIRTHKPALLAELAAANDEPDADVLRRRAKALAILAEQPERQIAVVAEAGAPAHVTVAVRGVAVGDLEIPGERYDAFALMALMDQHGHA
jgi:hypothetical protein